MDTKAGSVFLAALLLTLSCARQEPPPPVKAEKKSTLKVVRPKQEVMTDEQRRQLGFPARIISGLEEEAGSAAEPFFETVEASSENLRGEKGIEGKRLAGFSVRTAMADEILSEHSRRFRAQGYLIFRSRQNYGDIPDVVTVIKGGSSYDILRVQKTEAPSYRLDTKAIIAWLRERQKDAPFYLTGAGQDFVEARFLRQPANMKAFARKIVAFAPDVLREGPSTVDRLAERMKRTNGFRLVWD